MSQFIESIRLYNGIAENLELHNERCNKSRLEVLSLNDSLDLGKVIKPPRSFSKGLVKCKIVFAENVQEVTYEIYSIRNIQSIKIIKNDTINYQYKSLDRSDLLSIYKKREEADEILILQNNLVTDAYYYNVAFLKNDIWYTPSKPLLKGVRRTQLLNQNKLVEMDIRMDDIKKFTDISLFNALTPLGSIQLGIERII